METRIVVQITLGICWIDLTEKSRFHYYGSRDTLNYLFGLLLQVIRVQRLQVRYISQILLIYYTPIIPFKYQR